MKKVLIVYGGAKNRGGIYTYLEGLFSASKGDQEIELSLATIGNWPLGESLGGAGFDVWAAKKSLTGLLSGVKKVREYDLIVTMGLVSNFFGRFWALWARKPVATVVHSDWRTDYLSSPIKKFIFATTERLMRFVTRRYICVSEYLKSQLVAEGVKAEKITVIYNGVAGQVKGNPSRAQGGSGDPKEKKDLEIGNSKLKIVTAGRLHPVKNFENLIRACAGLSSENWSLTIYGEGDEREKLEKVVREYGLSDKVNLPGQVDNLAKKLAEADVYVQPSITEGFGLAVVEAMLVGLPVIVTPGGALPELVKDGETGAVTSGFGSKEIAESIEKMISGPENMKKMAEKGQKYAKENFDIDKWARKTIETYKEATR